MRIRCRLAIVLASVAATPVPVLAQESASVDPLLQAQYEAFSAAVRAMDASRVAEIYAQDAFYLSPGATIRRGREVILGIFADSFADAAAQEDQLDMEFTIVDRRIVGDAAIDVGYYELGVAEASGTGNRSRGKFVVVWQRGEDGIFRIEIDGYSDVDS